MSKLKIETCAPLTHRLAELFSFH